MSLTGANAQLLLSVSGLFPSPQPLQGFAVNDVFKSEQIKRIETRMGVDGVLSAGLLFVEKRLTIALQSNSPSIALFDAWIAAEAALVDTLEASMTVLLTGIQTQFNCVTGYLTDVPPLPDVGNLIGPRSYTITWQSIVPAPALIV